ncbi:hypothetical protein PAHAL_3G312500 [Panicum hallii]|uniref:Uncharacterized protein n=1 Tax=Panicum hallii TaxID=206008 RepID=A0A2S3HCU7_9POAL|nr:hypothetical protein PAHAL_3G312500 [Panicum hallii]
MAARTHAPPHPTHACTAFWLAHTASRAPHTHSFSSAPTAAAPHVAAARHHLLSRRHTPNFVFFAGDSLSDTRWASPPAAPRSCDKRRLLWLRRHTPSSASRSAGSTHDPPPAPPSGDHARADTRPSELAAPSSLDAITPPATTSAPPSKPALMPIVGPLAHSRSTSRAHGRRLSLAHSRTRGVGRRKMNSTQGFGDERPERRTLCMLALY